MMIFFEALSYFIYSSKILFLIGGIGKIGYFLRMNYARIGNR